MRKLVLCCVMGAAAVAVVAATVTETTLTLNTYPYSDPDPVPCTGETRYPYCFFDGTTAQGVTQQWQTVVLESDRLRVTVLPALGGKVWAAVHKPTGRDIVYCNHAVKFRNIAMRGPWCSGGIEFNFGIIGHAPSTSAPVDWFVRTNADGSASCFVGDTEAICRTSWQVEVNVRDGEDFFTTRVKWFNGSGLPVPYYQWMNAAFPARSDTEFVYPGANWIGHDGQAHTWPRDAAGRDWSRYACLAFGDAKSCHVLNGDHGVFGAWWPEIGFGSMHRSGVADKYGRKIFLWALSRAGGIWEDLLTDADGQYVELQSGRCFNQPESASSVTPFKHPSFAPGVTDAFEERWCAVTNRAAFDACVKDDGTYAPRPLALPKDFDRDSAYGHYVAGVQELNQRHDRAGAAELAKCLAKEPHFAPAHDALALLAIRRGLYAEAHRHAESALTVDTYDGAANYADGLAYFSETNLSAASERLGLASYSPLYRAAAFARLAVIELRRGRLNEAERMAGKALASEARQLDALRVRIVVARLKGDLPRAKRLAQEVLEAFPLCHAARYELQRLNPANIPFETFVRNEHPARTYADLGAWYAAAGLNDDAAKLYARAAASDPVAAANQAFLRVGSRDVLAAGARLPAAGVAPFRAEDLPALEAAVQANGNWKYAYCRAVLLAALGRDAEADAALEALGTVPDEAVFYQYRASRRKGAEALADLDRAAACGDNWRIGIARFKLHEKAGDWKAALAVVKPYVKPGATAEPVKVAYATALAESGAFAAALAYLRGETVLPSEFGFNAFGAWNRACRGLAEEALAHGDETAARKAAETAVSYPENLGVGRPYEIKLDKAPFDAWKGRARTLLEEASWSKHPSPCVQIACPTDAQMRALVVEPMRCSAMPVNIRWPGHQRELDQTEICHFARFDFSGKVTVRVTPNRPFTNVVVRPVSRQVAVTRDGDAVRFTITSAGAYSVEFDGRHENLMLFADPPRAWKIDRTAADVRYFGPGEHEVGVLRPKAGETIFLDEGAVVYGRIEARDADRLRICGRGILDASRVKEVPVAIDPKLAEEQRKKGWAITNVDRFDAIRLMFCDDVRIEGITVRDSQIYAIRPVCCDRFTVDNVKILGSWRYNSDGIDMHNCRQVRIRDSFIRTYDDSICVKGFDYVLPEKEMLHEGVLHDVFEDVLIERCTIWNDWGRALEIGAETRAREIRNVTFRDCDVLAVHEVALDVQNCDQAHVHDITFENIRVEYDPSAPKTVYSASAKDFDPANRRAPAALAGVVIPYIPEYSKGGAENRGRTSRVAFRNIDVSAPSLPGGFCRGFDAEHRATDVTFAGIRLNGRDVTDPFVASVATNAFGAVRAEASTN